MIPFPVSYTHLDVYKRQSQRYPSGVWAMERMEPLAKPSRIFQAVCAYWLTSSAGFSANAQVLAISMPASIAPANLP